ncbi:MAG TPA: class I SAM-dependent methyltransferase [Thermoleophilaceae bacterium]|nr:class I SAM-dependent methyltransferase [Thermoleophilaceae bacterium]
MIHRAAAEGFARSADAYERGRPRYPDEALALFLARLRSGATGQRGPGGPGAHSVLDLAAGTGVLTRPLLDAGLAVIAVEPVAEMRAALPSSARALDGTAEAIPLGSGEVDAVVVGQAFHWFDGDAALAEIHRVLRPDGLLALFWNRRVEDDPVNRAIDRLVDPYRADVPTHRSEAWRGAFDRTSLFVQLSQHDVPNEQRLDAGGMEARVGSISFIAALDAPERKRVLERARAIAGEGTVTVPHRTELLMWRRS